MAPTENFSSVLEARDVSKRFDGAPVDALSHISLDVKRGEFYSFLGPSGCGKTTMLRIFAGFENLSQGEIFVGGAPMKGIPPNKRPVNMVFQSYALFPHLSVLENVAFGLRAKSEKISRVDILTQSREALSSVRLSSFADRLPAQLSGGQQQRVALARALVMRPIVLLLDEPLSALDVQIREEMQDELARLQSELNITFVMVTHDQGEALALSSRVAVFNQGKIEQIGDPKQIYESPQTAFVAKFIGRSNVLTGEVLQVDAAAKTMLVDFTGRASRSASANSDNGSQPCLCQLDPLTALPAPGQIVEICVKPEAVSPVVSRPLAPSAQANTLLCRLQSSAYLGSLADLRLQIVDAAIDASLDCFLRATVPVQILAELTGQATFYVHLAPSDLRLLQSSSATTGDTAYAAT